MIPAEVRALADTIIGAAKAQLEQEGDLMPVVVLRTPTEVKIFGVVFDSSKQKRQVYRGLAQHARELGATAAVMINDTYYVKLDKDMDVDTVGAPSKHPQRQEMLSVVIHTKEHGKEQRGYPYHREDGHVVWDEPQEPLTDFEDFLFTEGGM